MGGKQRRQAEQTVDGARADDDEQARVFALDDARCFNPAFLDDGLGSGRAGDFGLEQSRRDQRLVAPAASVSGGQVASSSFDKQDVRVFGLRKLASAQRAPCTADAPHILGDAVA
jgi:hypothetical protein